MVTDKHLREVASAGIHRTKQQFASTTVTYSVYLRAERGTSDIA